MDCDSTKKPHKKFKSSLVYPDYINRLWRLLKDKSKILEICVDIKLLNSDSQNPQNNNSLLNNISCLDIVSTNFYKSVSYLILQNNNTTLNFKFILYPNTSDNSTLLFLELSSVMFCPKRFDIVPCAVHRTSLLIHSKYKSLHLPTPNFQSIPLLPPPPWQPQVCSPCL